MLVSFIRYSFTYIPTPVLHWISGVKCLSISPFSNDCLEGHFEVIDFQTLHFGMTFQIATVLPSKLPCVGFSYFVGTVMPECFCVWEREWPVKIYSPDHHLMWECCYPYSDLIMRELGGKKKTLWWISMDCMDSHLTPLIYTAGAMKNNSISCPCASKRQW